MRLVLFLLFTLGAMAQNWTLQTSGTNASLRGVSAVNSNTVWASGSGATWLRTADGGAHWQAGVVAGAEDSGQSLVFRGIRAMDAGTAYLLSSDVGAMSRVDRNTDPGVS